MRVICYDMDENPIIACLCKIPLPGRYYIGAQKASIHESSWSVLYSKYMIT
jgi:hypothetical protein